MKGTLAAAVLLLVAFVGFNRALGPTVSPDTPVRVLSASPIRVLLPIDPDARTIAGYVYAALGDAADGESGTLGRELEAMSRDGDLVNWIAERGEQRFATGKIAALAFPLYRVQVTSDLVEITSATLELLPQYRGVGRSIEHENGHATINTILGEECGPQLVATYADAGQRGRALSVSIQSALYSLGDDAHDHYHELVNGSRAPAYARAARLAAGTVVDAQCAAG